ncbi:hypothetical protein GE061_018728 [Apolygus lucorum]|uniref:Uncharacterized protein n=1 Tax=Apolygus lucorum TaxID=248454 RepID=A0A8S9X894_APOLU|nr:hypothetical protein GE061_018728 [Apolygus lucorum]
MSPQPALIPRYVEDVRLISKPRPSNANSELPVGAKKDSRWHSSRVITKNLSRLLIQKNKPTLAFKVKPKT